MDQSRHRRHRARFYESHQHEDKPRYAVEDIKKELSSNRSRFYESLKSKILPKIVADTEIMLANNWAGEVSPEDLYHCHVLIPAFYPVDTKGYSDLISANEVQLLYHSRESQEITNDRNIVSSLNSKPITFNGKRTLYPSDLRCWQSCQINFGLNEEDLNAQEYKKKFDQTIKNEKYHFGISLFF